MNRLNQAATQDNWVARIIDELKGKETKHQEIAMSVDEDNDKNDYELFDDKPDDVMDLLRQQQEVKQKLLNDH